VELTEHEDRPMNPQARNAYLNAAVTTATPQRLLVMLYDRLVLDIKRGIEAQRAGRYDEANTQLQHAQEIVNELRSSLKADLWEGGPQLASLYDWLFGELVRANTGRDVTVSESCLSVVEPLAQTWREAALSLATADAG
jgi:flagellar protein FliS